MVVTAARIKFLRVYFITIGVDFQRRSDILRFLVRSRHIENNLSCGFSVSDVHLLDLDIRARQAGRYAIGAEGVGGENPGGPEAQSD